MGSEVVLCGPPTLLPDDFSHFRARTTFNFDSILPELDVVKDPPRISIFISADRQVATYASACPAEFVYFVPVPEFVIVIEPLFISMSPSDEIDFAAFPELTIESVLPLIIILESLF